LLRRTGHGQKFRFGALWGVGVVAASCVSAAVRTPMAQNGLIGVDCGEISFFFPAGLT
jgi:hypothetical protein